MRRNFQDPKYIRWRKAVFARAKGKCQMPGCCGTEKRLNAHHIKRWANFPNLRFAVSNGVALCLKCHEKVTSREEEFEQILTQAVTKPQSDITLMMMLMRNADLHRPS